MSRLRLVLRSLAYHWRTGIVVAFWLATATAVVTGALVTGSRRVNLAFLASSRYQIRLND